MKLNSFSKISEQFAETHNSIVKKEKEKKEDTNQMGGSVTGINFALRAQSLSTIFPSSLLVLTCN